MAHVIITGGSSGIGAAIAEACALRGDSVSLIARRTEALERFASALETHCVRDGARIVAATADVSQPGSVTEAVALCERQNGPCDLLVTSAGVVKPGRFDVQAPETFEAQLATNLFGTINAVRAVYPGMVARRQGRVLMLGSGAGLIGVYGYTAYCASKYAVAGFAEALRAEARTFGVTISICYPPDTETPQLAGELPDRPAEATATIGAGGRLSANAVARAALAGVERGRFAIYPGAQMKMLGLFGSVAMPLLRPIFDRRIDRVRKTSGQ